MQLLDPGIMHPGGGVLRAGINVPFPLTALEFFMKLGRVGSTISSAFIAHAKSESLQFKYS